MELDRNLEGCKFSEDSSTYGMQLTLRSYFCVQKALGFDEANPGVGLVATAYHS